MENIFVECKDGLHREIVYSVADVVAGIVPLLHLAITCKDSRKRGRGRRDRGKITYLEIPCAFDIETTNIYQRGADGRIDSEAMRPYAFMYHWQFCIADYVIFGRTWEEFSTLLFTLSTRMDLRLDHRLVVYVHNLSFEFTFMHRFLNIAEYFFRDERKPLYVTTQEGIEFRCSYMLSNMNLQKFCENERGVVHYKLSGENYDYGKMRTSETPLTMEEKAYCYNDVRGLAECIRSRMESDTLAEMPLTSTGYVRRDFRNAMKKNPQNRRIFKNAEYDARIYTLLRRAFRGGDTHANIRAAGQIIHDVQSFDISSSYPGVMVTEMFPMGKFKKISNAAFKSGLCEKHGLAYIARMRFYDIKLKRGAADPYIPFSQCMKVEGHSNASGEDESGHNIYDNGRVVRADAIEIVLTDIDLKIVRECYDYGRAYVREVWATGYGYLPDEFRDQVRRYFRGKTELKGVEGKYYEYMRSKNRINAAYGMMVQRINDEEIRFENGEFETVQLDLAEEIQKFFKKNNNFLLYQWGVWVTAHARARLHAGITAAGRGAVYWDTDSVKCFGKDFTDDFKKLNEAYLQKAIDNYAFADDPRGVRHYMGVFEYEETYKRFITLGAKKYLVENERGELHSTIAGVGKKQGAEFFRAHGMEAFRAGCVIENSGHLVAYYNNDEIHTIEIDGVKMATAGNLALVDDTYTLGLTAEYADLLEKALNNSIDMIYTD